MTNLTLNQKNTLNLDTLSALRNGTLTKQQLAKEVSGLRTDIRNLVSLKKISTPSEYTKNLITTIQERVATHKEVLKTLKSELV